VEGHVTARVKFTGEVFEHSGEGSWHFVKVPADVAAEVRDLLIGPLRGFGSVKVVATIGDTTWSTSLFPVKEDRSYVLPVKKPVRSAEGILADDVVQVELEIVEGDEGDS
jgi:hypothetical protein